ncbi:MAG: hypothetical protein IPG34_07420 [Rhodocyclaceae bacterium]|nr:hypothetical protein [Rhodocyclaceae bacterium]
MNVFSDSATKVLRNLLFLGVFAPTFQLLYSLSIGKTQGIIITQIFVIVILATCYRELHLGRVARGLKIFTWSI